MKTRILIFLALIALALPMKAQWEYDEDTLSPVRLMVTYELFYREDTAHIDRARKDKMVLLMGDNLSLFESHSIFAIDENERKLIKEGTYELFWNDNVARNKFMNEHLVHFFFLFYKNFPEGRITAVDRALFSGSFQYEEDFPCMTWEYTEDTATIGNYFTQKAVCDYGGRIWEAWFTPELPYSDGPYKFCGLPGLIVKMADTQDHYRFEMVSIEVPADNIFIYWKKKDYVIKTTKKAFFKAYDDALANIIENALPNITPVNESKDDVQRSLYKYAISKNNPIELDRR